MPQTVNESMYIYNDSFTVLGLWVGPGTCLIPYTCKLFQWQTNVSRTLLFIASLHIDLKSCFGIILFLDYGNDQSHCKCKPVNPRLTLIFLFAITQPTH